MKTFVLALAGTTTYLLHLSYRSFSSLNCGCYFFHKPCSLKPHCFVFYQEILSPLSSPSSLPLRIQPHPQITCHKVTCHLLLVTFHCSYHFIIFYSSVFPLSYCTQQGQVLPHQLLGMLPSETLQSLWIIGGNYIYMVGRVVRTNSEYNEYSISTNYCNRIFRWIHLQKGATRYNIIIDIVSPKDNELYRKPINVYGFTYDILCCFKHNNHTSCFEGLLRFVLSDESVTFLDIYVVHSFI